MLAYLVALSLRSPQQISVELQAILEQACHQFNIPGATAAVATKNGIIAKAAYGIRKYGEPNPILPNDAMHIGSITKSMTALVVAKLVQEHKLQFDDPVIKFFPEATRYNPAFKTLTLRNLLNQQSGLPPKAGEYNYLPSDLTGSETKKRQRYVRQILQEKLDTQPGLKYSYNNANYILLGAIAEKITGRTYEDLLSQKVFAPLHLKTCGFGPMGNGKSAATPWQHLYQDGKPMPIYFDNPDWFTPAGRVHMSAQDLAKYGFVHCQEDPSYLPADLWSELHTPPKGSPYAMGWIRLDIKDYGHAGSNNLSCSELWIRRDREIAFAICFNAPQSKALTSCMARLDQLLAKHHL